MPEDSRGTQVPPLLWVLIGAILSTLVWLIIYVIVLGHRLDGIEDKIDEALKNSDKTIIDYLNRK